MRGNASHAMAVHPVQARRARSHASGAQGLRVAAGLSAVGTGPFPHEERARSGEVVDRAPAFPGRTLPTLSGRPAPDWPARAMAPGAAPGGLSPPYFSCPDSCPARGFLDTIAGLCPGQPGTGALGET